MPEKSELISTALDENEDPYRRLRALMTQLRNPDGGCEWDLDQTFKSIAPYTIEEAYEVADAINRNDTDEIKNELGDLLLQVFFHAQIAEDANLFTVEEVFDSITNKMISRHPHVFASPENRSAEQQRQAWETIKATERASKKEAEKVSAIDGVASALPALLRAEKLVKRAARIGFDFPDARSSSEKIVEELEETLEATGEDQLVEYGDLLFSVVCLGYKLGIAPEDALKAGNMKFEDRFRKMEKLLGGDLNLYSLEEMDLAWSAAKMS